METYKNEILVDIKGYEGKYKISSYGRVWSCKKKNNRPKFLKNDLRGKYYAIKLGKYGEKVSIHRLVALHFVDGYFDGAVVNHKDGNKLNNKFDNLEWVTYKENTEHAQLSGLMNIRTYPIFRRYKISKKQEKEVCDRYKRGEPVISIAKHYGVTRGAIYSQLSKHKINRRKYVIQ